MGRFNFTGTLRINAADSKYPSFRNGLTKESKAPYKSMVLFVNPADNNSGVVDTFGMKQDEIVTKDTEGNDLTIPWDDRKSKEYLNQMAGYKKHVLVVGDDRKEFADPYDLISFVEDNVDELKGTVVTISGRTRLNEYNGSISDRFNIQNIYQIAEDKVKDKKLGLFINDTIYVNKDSFDFDDWKEEGKIRVNGYTQEWVDKGHPNVYVAKQFVIDTSKLDWSDSLHVRKFNATFRPLGLAYADGKIKCNLKSSKYYSMAVNMKLINGAEESDFDVSMLTDAQRELVELGIKELSDFKPKGSIYGNRIKEYRIFACDLSVKDYEDGEPVEVDMKANEFEEMIYQTADSGEDVELGMNPPKDEKEEKSNKKVTPKKEKKEDKKTDEDEDEDDPLDDLFS